MKVLQVTNGYPTPDHPIFGIFVKEQIESIKRISGIEVDLFFINAKAKGKMEYLRSIFELRKKARDYDILHCHHAYSAIIALFARSKRNKILISFMSTGVMELTFQFPVPFASVWYKWVVKSTDARIFKFGIPAELKNDKRSYYIPNGVNLQLFQQMGKANAKRSLGLDTTKRYLLFVSSGSVDRSEKRYDKFLAVMDQLQSKYGITDIAPLTLVNEKRENVPLYFNAADIHLLCSDVEGSPNSVKESMACNTRVVTTNVGNVNDMLSGVSDCFISDSKQVGELAAFCNTVLTTAQTTDLRERLKNLQLDIDSVAHKIVNIYRQLTEQKN